MHYDLEAPRDARSLPHSPLKAIVAPRPIGWISAMSADGRLNLAPYSFFNAVADDMVAFSSAGRKDAMTFAEEGGDFVCSLATWDLRAGMNDSSAPLPRGERRVRLREPGDRALAQGAHAPGRRLAGRPRMQVAADGPPRADRGRRAELFPVIGQVVSIYLDERFVEDGMLDTAAMQPIMRGGYFDYFRATPETRFQLRRPKGAGEFRES